MPNFFSLFNTVRISVPPELASVADLLNYLGLSSSELKKIWWFRERMYHSFELSKKGGKKRYIQAPDDRLKYLQQMLLPLLNQLYRVRHPVHGFVTEKSVKTNAQAHLQRRFILNIDLKDFFPSITEKRIVGVLKSLNLDMNVSKIVARIACCNGCLPQGAPTSPVLSNMICFRLDKDLLALAKKNRCIYTRYADDITFSSYQQMASLFEAAPPPAGHFSPELLAPILRNVFAKNGFTLNPNKAHYADRHSRKMVTGIKVNQILNVDRRYVRNIRAAIHSVKTLGRIAAQEKFEKKLGGTSELGSYLRGKIVWLRYIRGQSDPVFRALATQFNLFFPECKIEVIPTKDEVRDRSVWVVDNFVDMVQGSAFFLKNVGLVTAAHCVATANKLDVYHPSKQANKFTATVKMIDNNLDLAILEHDIPATEYFELERSVNPIAVGDTLTALGYPGFGPGDKVNVRPGIVSSLPTKNTRLIEVMQKLAPGMSGGPLLDANFLVAGIIHKGGPDEGRDFAVHIEVLNNWLAENEDKNPQ